MAGKTTPSMLIKSTLKLIFVFAHQDSLRHN